MNLSLGLIIVLFLAALVFLIVYLGWKFLRKKFWYAAMPLAGIIIISFGIFCWQKNLESTYTEKYHEPNPEKSKVAVVISRGGIYDSDKMASQISEYYQAVIKDLGIENAGLKKYEGGKTFAEMDELDKFVDELYLNEDVAYIVFVGDDLPIGDTTNEETHAQYLLQGVGGNIPVTPIQHKLGCVNKDCNFAVPPKALKPTEEECVMPPPPISASKSYCKILRLQKDIGISFILPPIKYSNEDKVNFVLNVLKTYTNYHNNFAAIAGKYQKSVLAIYGGWGITESSKNLRDQWQKGYKLGYKLPYTPLSPTLGEYEQISNELKKKHLVLLLGVHGTRTTVGLGFKKEGQITLEEWSSFVKENGLPALFVESDASESLFMRPDPLEDKERTYCCWPQIFMESGVWAYSSYGMSANLSPGTEGLKVREYFSTEETLGLAIRKSTHSPVIWGDILAHLK